MTQTARTRSLRQWLTLAVAVLVLAALCLLASRWQWSRYETKKERVDVIAANYSAPQAPLAQVLPDPTGPLSAGQQWRQVTVSGKYLAEHSVYLRNRPVSSQAGLHVLTPFQLTSGERLVVNRGFFPGSDLAQIPPPPAGEIRLQGRLRLPEPNSERGAPAGQVQRINPENVFQVAGLSHPDIAGWYLAALSENGGAPAGLTALPRPDLDLGSHLSYTFQWIVFAVGAVSGFIILLRRERREAKTTAGETVTISANAPADVVAWAQPKPPAKRGRKQRDEDAEDAEIAGGSGQGN